MPSPGLRFGARAAAEVLPAYIELIRKPLGGIVEAGRDRAKQTEMKLLLLLVLPLRLLPYGHRPHQIA